MTWAYDELGTEYDAWCRSVTEDIEWYVERALESGGPVLEIGVGSGRVAVPTAISGVRVVGVDISDAMLELARRRAAPHRVVLELHRADMRELPDLGSFPLITIPFRALLHLSSDAERLAVLRSLRARLLPGGRLVFDVFHPDRRDIRETHERWIEREPGIWEYASWRPQERSLTLRVRSDRASASMELWWLPPSEWERLLREAGFSQITSYGWFDERPLRDDSPDSVWIVSG